MLALGKLWIMLWGRWPAYTQQGPKAAVPGIWKEGPTDTHQMIHY